MITVSVDSRGEKVFMECSESIANEVINAMYSKLRFDMSTKGNNLILSLDIGDIDVLNRELKSFKKHIVLDNSFILWKEKHKGKAPVVIRVGVVDSKIYKGQYTLPHKEIEDACKYFFAPAVRQKKFKEGKWDGYIHLYKKWLHQFPTGLLDKVCDVLDRNGIPYRVEYTYEVDVDRQFGWQAKHLFEPEEDQWEALNACIKGKRGICKAPTGFGKVI